MKATKLIRLFLTEKRKQKFDIVDDSTHLVSLVIVKNGVKFQSSPSAINIKYFRDWYKIIMSKIERKIIDFEKSKSA